MQSGSGKVEETEYEKELAKVLSEEWQYYQTNLVPVESQVIEDAKASNNQSVYDEISKNSNLAVQKNSTEQNKQVSDALTTAGVDPSSGKYSSTMNKLSDLNASKSADVQSTTEQAGQRRHIDTLSNVVATGQGEATQAVSSLSDLASDAQKSAQVDAQITQQGKDDVMGAVGAAGGAYLSHSRTKKNDDIPDPNSLSGYDPNAKPMLGSV